MLMPVGLILFGFILLIGGGELLVRGASGLARAMRIPPLIVGLTVVAFCTSAPELAVSVQAAIAGKTDLAVGNVVGSCICNILLVLGISALITPLIIDTKLVRREVPLLIAITSLFFWFCRSGELTRAHGLIMVGGLIAYILWTILQARRESKKVQEEMTLRASDETHNAGRLLIWNVLLLLAGLGLLVLGSDVLVKGAVDIATQLGVSKLMIGLTVLAIGTSLPEVAITIIAALRGKRELAVGNVIGSNVFNILGVLGLTAAISPIPIPVPSDAITFDLPVMLGVTIVCFPIFISGSRIARSEGMLFILFYVAYIGCLVVTEVSQELGDTLRFWVFYVGGPVVLVTCFILAFRPGPSKDGGDNKRK